MSASTCRWCHEAGPGLRRVAQGPADGVLGARARRMARVPVLEHPACYDRWEAAHEAAERRRAALHAQAREAIAAGDLAAALALVDQAADVLDSDHLAPTP